MRAPSKRRTWPSRTTTHVSSSDGAASRWRSGSSHASPCTRSSTSSTNCRRTTTASTAIRSRRNWGKRVNAQALLELADDELILGWRNSEWTGIAPLLEEDVAFSSISQNEIGHARALYELAARELGTDADALAFDRAPEEYRCAPLVELRRLEWARTIARHWLYEVADEIRLAALKASDDAEIAGLAAKIDREEAYHRMHAEMWIDRLLASEEGTTRLRDAVEELWPYALGVLDDALRPQLVERVRERLPFPLAGVEPVTREQHTAELRELWEQMTEVRRSAPVGAQW